MSKKGGRGTPPHLDYLFDRNIIDDEDVVDFWTGYWQRRFDNEREQYVAEWLRLEQLSREEKEKSGQDVLKISGQVTKVKQTAVEQAASIGGKVVRRNARGQFCKRGHYYQAVAKPQRKKTV